MNNATNLNSFKEKKNAPDTDQVYIGTDGVKWFNYVYSYKDGRGITMTFNLWATSLDDAQERLDMVKDRAVLDGQMISEID